MKMTDKQENGVTAEHLVALVINEANEKENVGVQWHKLEHNDRPKDKRVVERKVDVKRRDQALAFDVDLFAKHLNPKTNRWNGTFCDKAEGISVKNMSAALGFVSITVHQTFLGSPNLAHTIPPPESCVPADIVCAIGVSKYTALHRHFISLRQRSMLRQVPKYAAYCLDGKEVLLFEQEGLYKWLMTEYLAGRVSKTKDDKALKSGYSRNYRLFTRLRVNLSSLRKCPAHIRTYSVSAEQRQAAGYPAQ